MSRIGSLSLLGVVVFVVGIAGAANPPDDAEARFQKTLAVHTAMARARILLSDKNSQKAVEILEEQLRNVNGNAEYLALLRDAYRSHVKDLYFAGQPEAAKRYVNRLIILDPQAANDPTLRPQGDGSPRKFEPEPVKQAKGIAFPKFALPTLTNPFTKKEEPSAAPPPTMIRGQVEDSAPEDPFDRKNQRITPMDSGKAQELLTLGAQKFANKNYAEARRYFEQAYQTDQSSLEVCREQWAYCLIKGVTDQMEMPGVGNWSELQKQVEAGVKMAPKLDKLGNNVLQEIDQRAKKTAPVGAPKVKHWGQNREGWQVAETPNFRIFHRQDEAFAERAAQIAEHTRLTMYRKWFGHDGIAWEPTCELILHPNSAGYTQMTSVPSSSPGHSRIESDRSGRVIARRMDLRCDITTMMDAVLPHEATHVVLAGMFGTAPVPRWVDEGIAVLSEPEDKIAQHRRNFAKFHQERELFGLRELMELQDYPHARRIGAFYAQSVVMVEFLANQKSPKTFTDFVKEGMLRGYETALQKHYGMTFAQLEQEWNQQVLTNPHRYAARK